MVNHARRPERRRTSSSARGRTIAVVLGIPVGLAALAVALTALSPSQEGLADVPVSSSSTVPAPGPVTPSASVSPADPVEPSGEPSGTPTVTTSESPATSGGQSGRSQANRSNPGLDVVWSVDTDDPVFFITVDDNVRDPGVAQAGLEVVRDNNIPITAFLTTNFVSKDTDYFNEITSFGGSIQNHTVTHPFFNKPGADPVFELCTASDRLEAQFGTRPWMMRPPFGEPYMSGSSPAAVESAAVGCGINRIVMWSAVVDNGKVSYNPGPTLRPGDIVLFHFWDPKFAEGLEMILEIGRANGLTPAPLEDYL